MGRTLPRACPPIPKRPTPPDRFEIAVETPMFGGGVSPGQVDESMLVRPATVRGHLRFWWRATQGTEFTSVEDLRNHERCLWGSADERSRVEVTVSVTNKGSAPPHRTDPQKYVLYPFKVEGRLGVRFTLGLRYPAGQRDEVETALRAWVNFGGIGARTRRGCGALYCKELALRNAEEVRDHFRWGAACPGWPVLGEAWVSNIQRGPVEAWEHVIGLMREFRQGTFGRNWTGAVPHLSRWPEADSLRRITGEFLDPGHRPSANGPCAFPRAELGLPIQFQFKDRDEKVNNCELLPVDRSGATLTRMASPVILRPLIVEARRAFAMLVTLNTPGVLSARLKIIRKAGFPDPSPLLDGRDVPTGEIRNAVAAKQLGSPLAGSASALTAFLNYARSRL